MNKYEKVYSSFCNKKKCVVASLQKCFTMQLKMKLRFRIVFGFFFGDSWWCNALKVYLNHLEIHEQCHASSFGIAWADIFNILRIQAGNIKAGAQRRKGQPIEESRAAVNQNRRKLLESISSGGWWNIWSAVSVWSWFWTQHKHENHHYRKN